MRDITQITAAMWCVLFIVTMLAVGYKADTEVSDKDKVDSCGGIPNCATCSNPDLTCTLCQPNATMAHNGSMCLSCPPGCGECSDDAMRGIVCDQCLTGYSRMENKTCLECPLGCLQCALDKDDAVFCSRCQDHYRRISNVGTCIACPENCKSCEDTVNGTICGLCNDGFVLDYHNNICLLCPEECSSCYTMVTNYAPYCLGCKEHQGLFLNKGKCQTCVRGDGCIDCEDDVNCKKCKPYYMLRDGGECQECPEGCEECSYQSPRHTKCLTCGEGNGLRGTEYNICDACEVDHCSDCIFTKKCVMCDLGYALHNNKCIKCPGDQCAWCLATTSGRPYCAGCSSGYGVKSLFGECEECPDYACAHCIYSNPTNDLVCWMCNGGYNITLTTDDDTGIRQAQCNLSDPIYDTLNCPARCYVCYSSIDGERRCHEDSCKPGSRYENGQCVTCPSHCIHCEAVDDDVTCRYCAAGYGPGKDGICTECAGGCSQCAYDEDDNLVCLDCLPGYEFNDTPCAKCPTDCATCHNEYGIMVCDTCIAGYSFINARDKCIKCPDRCRSCFLEDDKIKCSACDRGLHMKTETRECLSCSEIFTPHCISCSRTEGDSYSNFTCHQCEDGHVLKDDGQICLPLSSLPYCASGEDKRLTCSQCADGFLGNRMGTCSPHCGICANFSSGIWGTEDECGIHPDYFDYRTEPCDDGTCWVHVRTEGGKQQHARGCMRKACPGEDNNTEFCTEDKGVKTCSKCCTGHLCDATMSYSRNIASSPRLFYLPHILIISVTLGWR